MWTVKRALLYIRLIESCYVTTKQAPTTAHKYQTDTNKQGSQTGMYAIFQLIYKCTSRCFQKHKLESNGSKYKWRKV